MKANKILLSAMLASALATTAIAGPKIDFNDGKSSIEIFNMVQVWGMSTVNADAATNVSNDYADGQDLFIRRGRIGVKGKYSDLIDYKVWMAYDMIGKDGNNIMMGAGQADDNKAFYIWDAYFTYKFDKELANVTLGYFRPQVGKESITSGFTTTSYEKGLSNFYVRTHLVGRGPGREVGANIGGLTLNNKLNYNFGIFAPNHSKITGAATSTPVAQDKSSLLATARVAYTIGDAEMNKYKIGYKTNYFGKRKGVTIGLDYAYQGENDKFKTNSYMGFDMLANYGNLNASYEFNKLERDYTNTQKAATLDDSSDIIQTAHLSYNIPLESTILEPAIMWSNADIEDKSYFKTVAKEYVNGTQGSQTVVSVGVNWYRNKYNEKYGIHFAQFDKDAVAGDSGNVGQTQSLINFTAQWIF